MMMELTWKDSNSIQTQSNVVHNVNLTVDMLTARAFWMKTVATTLTRPARKEETVRG